MSSSFDPREPGKLLGEKTLGPLRYAMQLVLPLFAPTDTRTKPGTTKKKRPASPRPGSGGTVNGDGVKRHTVVRGEAIHYLFKRRPRKSIGFTIDQRGLIVSAPRWVTIAEVDEAVAEKSGWISRKLLEWEAFEARRAQLDTCWEDGGSFRYLGDPVWLNLSHHGETEPSLSEDENGKLHLSIGLADDACAPENVRIIVESWCQSRARDVLGQRLDHFANLLGQAPKRWHLSSARTQWGSCNAHGVIRLNWRLIHLPMALLDYVVAHEVAHLRELNHSAAFWRVVEDLIPDYEQARETLNAMPEHLAL
jgi:predicted metal-dependent hydrolase